MSAKRTEVSTPEAGEEGRLRGEDAVVRALARGVVARGVARGVSRARETPFARGS